MFAKLFKKVKETASKIGGVLVLLAIADFFLKWNLLVAVWNFVINPIKDIGIQLQAEAINSPTVVFILFFITVVFSYLLVVLWKRINVVAEIVY